MWWVYFSSLHSDPRGYVSPVDALLQQRDKDVWVRNPREAQQQSGHLHAASNWAETSLLSHAFCSHAWILADGTKLSWLFTHYWTSQWLSPDLSSMEGGCKLFCLYKLFKCMLRLNMGKVKNKTRGQGMYKSSLWAKIQDSDCLKGSWVFSTLTLSDVIEGEDIPSMVSSGTINSGLEVKTACFRQRMSRGGFELL